MSESQNTALPDRNLSPGMFALLLTLLFFCVTLMNTLNHEAWRDEMQAWMLARDNATPVSLYKALRYEGHPGLWHSGLWAISRFTPNPKAMQFYNLFLITLAIFIFCRWSPFNRLQKALFCFGYYPIYEWGAIARNYGIGMLLLFAWFAVMHSKTKHRLILSTILMLLLIQINIFCFIISIAWCLHLVFRFFREEQFKKFVSQNKPVILLCCGLYLLGAFLSILQLKPPADSGFFTEWYFTLNTERFSFLLQNIWNGMVPVATETKHFWNTNFIPSHSLRLVLGLLMFAGSLFLLHRNTRALTFYVIGMLGLLGFMYIKYLGVTRHWGHFYILLILAVWSAKNSDEKIKHKILNQSFQSILIIIFVANIFAGYRASRLESRYVFSQGGAIAKFITEQNLNDLPLMGNVDHATMSVAAILNRKIYYPMGDRDGTYVIWNKDRTQPLTKKQILQRAGTYAAEKNSDIILILNFKPDWTQAPEVKHQKLTTFAPPISMNESYYIFRIKNPNP